MSDTKIVLHQPHSRAWGTPNLSPFCTKLECYLRIAEVPHEVVKADFRKAPKGKIPFVELDGAFVGDSQLIIDAIEKRRVANGKRALDDGLSAHDRALAHTIRRTVEEALYFVALYTRWKMDDGYAIMRDEFKKEVPGFIIPLIRRRQIKKLHMQGTGRHSFDEVMQMGIADVDAIAALLGDRPFLLGDVPRVVDCTAFAFVESLLGHPIDTPLRKRTMEHTNLTVYRKRIRDRWWTDLPPLAS